MSSKQHESLLVDRQNLKYFSPSLMFSEMESLVNKVSEGIERGTTALGHLIDDIQYRETHVEVPRLQSMLSPRSGSLSSVLSSVNPAWRQLSVFSAWSSVKICVMNNNKTVNNSDIQVPVFI